MRELQLVGVSRASEQKDLGRNTCDSIVHTFCRRVCHRSSVTKDGQSS